MSDNLQRAKDKIELVQLLNREVDYENQPREQMQMELELAIANIKTYLDQMDTVDSLKGVDDD